MNPEIRPSVKIHLPTEPSYWGSVATPEDVDRILTRLEEMISMEFGEKYELEIARVATPSRTGITCESQDIHDEIHAWIGSNFTAAI